MSTDTIDPPLTRPDVHVDVNVNRRDGRAVADDIPAHIDDPPAEPEHVRAEPDHVPAEPADLAVESGDLLAHPNDLPDEPSDVSADRDHLADHGDVFANDRTELDPVAAACAGLRAAVDRLLALELALTGSADVVTALDTVETQARRLPAARDTLIAEVRTRDIATDHGHRSTSAWLRTRYRISGGEARTWLRGAERLTPRRSLTGEALEPLLPATAAARATGTLSTTHVKIIDDLDDELPTTLPVAARRHIEQAMVTRAETADPMTLTRLGQHLLNLVDPDGEQPTEEEAQRRRGITIGPLRKGLARINGHVDAWTREAILAVLHPLAHPDPPTQAHHAPPTAPDANTPDGANNPTGDDPTGDDTAGDDTAGDDTTGDPTSDDGDVDGARSYGDADPAPGPDTGDTGYTGEADGADTTDGATASDCSPTEVEDAPQPLDPDRRTGPQRLHDALRAAFERLLTDSRLPRRGGTPATILLTIPLATLEARTGYASTPHGGHIPIREVIRRANDTAFIPIVIDQNGNPLYLGRRQRLANPTQRLALHARDQGCVIPGCTTPSEDCQAHHLIDWADGGPTDLNNLALLCHYHHRRIKPWTLQLKNGRIWCTPPPLIDKTQTPRTNTHFDPIDHALLL